MQLTGFLLSGVLDTAILAINRYLYDGVAEQLLAQCIS